MNDVGSDLEGFLFYNLVFQYDPGFQEDPSQPFSESDEDVNDTDGKNSIIL